jgi:hypothetical protein
MHELVSKSYVCNTHNYNIYMAAFLNKGLYIFKAIPSVISSHIIFSSP